MYWVLICWKIIILLATVLIYESYQRRSVKLGVIFFLSITSNGQLFRFIFIEYGKWKYWIKIKYFHCSKTFLYKWCKNGQIRSQLNFHMMKYEKAKDSLCITRIVLYNSELFRVSACIGKAGSNFHMIVIF